MKKQRWEESEKRRAEERRSEKRKSQKKEDAGARKGRKVAKHCVFPMICGSGGSKSRLAKAAGAEPAGQMRDEKLHAVVARSTFRSQKCKKKLGGTGHFWAFKCRFFFGVAGAGIVHLIVKSEQSEQNVRVLWQCQLQPPLHYTTLQLQLQLQQQLRYTTLRYNTLHSTTLHSITLRYTTLHQLQLQLQLLLHYTTLHYITLYYLHYTPLHFTPLHSITSRYATTTATTTLHYTNYIALHYTTLHYTTLHHTPTHHTTLH